MDFTHAKKECIFTLTVIYNKLLLVQSIGNHNIKLGEDFKLLISSNTFKSPDENALTYSATYSDNNWSTTKTIKEAITPGTQEWLTFDPGTKTIYGANTLRLTDLTQDSANEKKQVFKIKITVKDFTGSKKNS